MNMNIENERESDISNIDFINVINWNLYLFFKYNRG